MINFVINNIDDYLRFLELERGVIRLDDVVIPEYTNHLDMQLHYLLQKEIMNVEMRIASPGGDVYAALALFDVMHKMQKQGMTIIAVAQGLAASAASMIVLQGATRRLATPNTRIHLHEISTLLNSPQMKQSAIDDVSSEIKDLSGSVLNIISERTGKSVDQIKRLIKRREKYMRAEEALKNNLIDEIVS